MARAVAKKRKKAARQVSQRPKAPRTEAQIAAAQANIAKARDAREAKAAQAPAASESRPLGHPADENRPKAFFALGEKREKSSDKGDKAEAKADKPEPKALTLSEVESLRKKLIEMLVSLWELADKGLTATAFDGEECLIWRTIDDGDTAFLADRILAKGRENPYVGAQVRMLIDHWSDARMAMILGPRLMESAGWHQAHGLRVAFMGLDIQTPPKAPRRKRGSNGHQAQTPPTQPYTPEGSYPYVAQ